jgi:hypothetical protein
MKAKVYLPKSHKALEKKFADFMPESIISFEIQNAYKKKASSYGHYYDCFDVVIVDEDDQHWDIMKFLSTDSAGYDNFEGTMRDKIDLIKLRFDKIINRLNSEFS